MSDPEEKATKNASKNRQDAQKEAQSPPVGDTEESAPKRKARPASARGAVVGAGDTDDVSLSRIVFKNKHARKSLSVHHLQRRLLELGYGDAYADRDGYYGDLTYKSVAEFQRDEGLDTEEFGIVDAATLEAIFENDSNVRVTP